MIYFADAGDGRIKVGTARDVELRLSQLNAPLAEPLILLGSIDGAHAFERAIHDHLAPYRVKGEWFRDCAEVRKTIRNLILVGPKAIGFRGPTSKKATMIEMRARKIKRPAQPITFRDLVIFAAPGFEEEYLVEITGCDPALATAWLENTTEPTARALAAVFANILSRIDCGSRVQRTVDRRRA